LVVEHLTTREEIDRSWSIDDLADGNEVLDAWHEARAAPKK
jgi:hypothetical protein